MLIDSHVHIGNKKLCEYIINHSEYKNLYRIYSCINPNTIPSTKAFLKDVDNYFALPLFFCETDIEEANRDLLRQIQDDNKAIPVMLLCKNKYLRELVLMLDYNILKEHFTLHNPTNISDRSEVYDYLNSTNGFLLLHTLPENTYSHIMDLRKQFPNIRIILAHLGRNGLGDFEFTSKMIDSLYADENIYTDISTISDPELIRYAFKRFGRERILYGSDFPFEVEPDIREKDYIQPSIKANLASEEYDCLYYKNAKEIIKDSKINKKDGKDNEMEY